MDKFISQLLLDPQTSMTYVTALEVHEKFVSWFWRYGGVYRKVSNRTARRVGSGMGRLLYVLRGFNTI